jgi:carbamoyl-phosphate synthase large subunit
VLLSLGLARDKFWFAEEATIIAKHLKLPIFATEGTAAALREVGIESTPVTKGPEAVAGSALHAIETGLVDLVINAPREFDKEGRPDGYYIRRRAVDLGIPLFTDLNLARAVVEALHATSGGPLPTRSYDEYLARSAGG